MASVARQLPTPPGNKRHRNMWRSEPLESGLFTDYVSQHALPHGARNPRPFKMAAEQDESVCVTSQLRRTGLPWSLCFNSTFLEKAQLSMWIGNDTKTISYTLSKRCCENSMFRSKRSKTYYPKTCLTHIFYSKKNEEELKQTTKKH